MYKTELTEKILQSPMAQTIIQEISPIYGESYTVLWLIQIIGTVLDSMKEWAESVEKQVIPQTATWSLPYWEEQYGIVTDETWSEERRRQNIVNKMRHRSPMNPKKLEDIVSVAAGYPARIEELTGKNHFTVYLDTTMDRIDEAFVRSEIDKAKPAHLLYTLITEQYTEAELYIGGAITAAKEVTLKDLSQVDDYILLQEKTITENGTYTADPGYDGLGKVIVAVETGEESDLPLAEQTTF